MEKMAIDSHKQTIVDLLQEGEAILSRAGDRERAQALESIRMETEKKREPVVMFYGLYNAGKSTLGNALCRLRGGAELKMGDIPTTVSIQEIHWNGYTLIDTPGINAQDAHTEIAEGEIRKSDVIFFVVDNSDTFDTELVYEAIVKILKIGKPLAIVINQKNVSDDDDLDCPVAEQTSIRTVYIQISNNLTKHAVRHGLQLAKQKNFLGIYPVNARDALAARDKTSNDEEQILEQTGVNSLRNVFNDTIRRSEVVYMLSTPLGNLRDILREAVRQYQADSIYGEKQDMARNREALLASRQRLYDRLIADGLRKIDAILDDTKAAAAGGQSVEGVDQQISETLNALLKEAATQECAVLQKEIKIEAMPGYRPESSGEAHRTNKDDDDSVVGDLSQIASFIIDIAPIPLPIPVPLSIITIVIRIITRFFKDNTSEDDAAARSQEQLANYYKWLNELRDQEIKIKATYEKSVNDFLAQFYDPQLEKIDQALTEVDSSCAEHTKNLQAMEQLQLRVGDELVALAVE